MDPEAELRRIAHEFADAFVDVTADDWIVVG